MDEELKEKTPQPLETLPIKKKKPWLIITLIVLIVIIFGAIGVLAYQNYLLKNKIKTKNTNLKEIPVTSTLNLATTPIPENWETFSTEGIFGLTQEILEEYPSVFNGNLSFSYPKSWNLRIRENGPVFSNGKKYGVFLGFSLEKSHPNYSSPGELPPENSAYMIFRFKITNLTSNQLIENFPSEFGHGSLSDKPVKDVILNGFEAAEIIRDQEFPNSIVFSISPTTVIVIDTDFFDNDEDKVYSEETIKEINGILDSIKIQEN